MKPGFGWAAYVLAGFLFSSITRADVIAIGQSAFPSSATSVVFDGLDLNTEVNGLTVDGLQFTYAVGGVPVNGEVVIDGGPGTTNSVLLPNIVSIGDNTGTLTILLPSPVNFFGYGFAILNENVIPDATTISAFGGTTLLGSLSFSGAPDPIFTGGFAGIQSTSVFDRVELTFNSSDAPAFALDNVIFASTVPEPSTMFMALLGVGAVATLGFRNRQ
jgi:hypothetical protein